MKRGLLTVVTGAMALGLLALDTAAQRAAAPIPVMLLDGESGGRYHDWKNVTPVLRTLLDETGLFAVTIVTTPPTGSDFSAFSPEWAKYQAVVMNYDAPFRPGPASRIGIDQASVLPRETPRGVGLRLGPALRRPRLPHRG